MKLEEEIASFYAFVEINRKKKRIKEVKGNFI
jgi:hypothetical protein